MEGSTEILQFIMILTTLSLMLISQNNKIPINQEHCQEEAAENSTEYYAYITFIETGRCLEIPETLENALRKALIDEQISEFVSTYEADYKILTEKEKRKCIQKNDDSEILKDYQQCIAAEDDIWFGFADSQIYIIRHPIEQGEYAYYEFLPAGVTEDFSYVMRALGKNEEYFLIQWEGNVYVITTKRENGKLIGIATYCMQGETIYGWMMYQEKSADNSISTKYYGYTTTGAKDFGTYWPEY